MPGKRLGEVDTGLVDGFDEELAFWDRELSLTGDHAGDISNRLSPEKMERAFPAYLAEWMDRIRAELGRVPDVLDVGSGPLSMLAHGHRIGTLNLTAVDPLADRYVGLLRKHGHAPTSPLQQGYGEELSQIFGANAFDVVWCHNALDHSQDPERVLTEMTAVLRPGGLLFLLFWTREATAEGFHGLHQHDLIWREGRSLVLHTSRADAPLRVAVLNDSLPLQLVEGSPPSDAVKTWVRTVWRKRSRPPAGRAADRLETIVNLEAMLEERSTEIANLRSQLDGGPDPGVAGDALSDVTERHGEAIARLEGEIRTRDEAVTRLEGEIRTRDEAVTRLEGEIRTRDEAVRVLERELALRDEWIGTITASRAWRLARVAWRARDLLIPRRKARPPLADRQEAERHDADER